MDDTEFITYKDGPKYLITTGENGATIELCTTNDKTKIRHFFIIEDTPDDRKLMFKFVRDNDTTISDNSITDSNIGIDTNNSIGYKMIYTAVGIDKPHITIKYCNSIRDRSTGIMIINNRFMMNLVAEYQDDLKTGRKQRLEEFTFKLYKVCGAIFGDNLLTLLLGYYNNAVLDLK